MVLVQVRIKFSDKMMTVVQLSNLLWKPMNYKEMMLQK